MLGRAKERQFSNCTVVGHHRFILEDLMRWLSALLLCGFLALASAVVQQAPPSLAMQTPEPTPPSNAARAFCPEADQITPIDADWPFDPLGPEVSVAIADDVEQAMIAAAATPAADEAIPTPYKGKLRMNFVTLAPGDCTLGSHYYPAAIIAVMSGELEILVELGPDAPAGAPLPKATVRRDNAAADVPDLTDDSGAPVSFVVSEDDWVSIENRSIVGYRNIGSGYAQILVAGLYPAAPGGGGNCGNGCKNRG